MVTATQSIGLIIAAIMIALYGTVWIDYVLNRTAILQHRARAVAGELEKKEKKMSDPRER